MTRIEVILREPFRSEAKEALYKRGMQIPHDFTGPVFENGSLVG